MHDSLPELSDSAGTGSPEVALNLQKTALENLIIPRLYKGQTAFMSMVSATKFLGITTKFLWTSLGLNYQMTTNNLWKPLFMR